MALGFDRLVRVLVLVLAVLVGLSQLSAADVADPVASYFGPFNGAINSSRIAQEFEISVAGPLDSILIYGGTHQEAGTFRWFLRDANGLVGTDIDALPVLASGSADFPSGYSYTDPSEIELFVGLGLDVSPGDRLLVELQQQTSSFHWMGGAGSLPGDSFRYEDEGWIYHWATDSREFGRAVLLVCEPASLSLLGLGLASLACARVLHFISSKKPDPGRSAIPS